MTPSLTPDERAYLDALERGDDTEADRLEHIVEAEVRARTARLEAPDALARTALWYAKRGLPVFPLQPACPVPAGTDWRHQCPIHETACGKAPLTRNGFKDATTDPGQVTAWWRRNPRANIGTPTGLSFDVIDVDGPEGLHVFNLDLPPRLAHVTTPRGGGHHLYVAPSGKGNRAKIWPGVDYRGIGGYVVLPPSVGGNGRRYKWLHPLELDTPDGGAAA